MSTCMIKQVPGKYYYKFNSFQSKTFLLKIKYVLNFALVLDNHNHQISIFEFIIVSQTPIE